MPNPENFDSAAGNRKHDAMGRMPTNTEEQLPEFAIKLLLFGCYRAKPGILAETFDRGIDGIEPTSGLLGRTIVAPPCISCFDVGFSSRCNDQVEHQALAGNPCFARNSRSNSSNGRTRPALASAIPSAIASRSASRSIREWTYNSAVAKPAATACSASIRSSTALSTIFLTLEVTEKSSSIVPSARHAAPNVRGNAKNRRSWRAIEQEKFDSGTE